MFLQTSMTNRRKFLERSMLGFGGALLLPSLLTSCTDHIINPPNPPIFPPLLGDYEIDPVDAARTTVIAVVGKVPVVGDILGPLLDILWPTTQPDVWDQIRARVEQLVDQKISDTVYQIVTDDLGFNTQPLGGLYGAMTLYLQERDAFKNTPNSSPAAVLDQWTATNTVFTAALPHFQSNGQAGDFRVLLLPLFAQFANLHLSLLRDKVIYGKSWGRTDDEYTTIDVPALKNAISGYYGYAAQWYETGRFNVASKTKPDKNLCEPWRSINAYDRQMTLTVLDFMWTWPYFDVTQFPNGAVNPDGTKINILTREIYSDPYGSCDDSGGIDIPQPTPTQLPTNITVWAHDRVDAVQVTYPAGSGPGGVTQTARMGDQSGGDMVSLNLSPSNPITQARAATSYYQNNNATAGPLVMALAFKYQDGTSSVEMGGGDPGFNGPTYWDWVGYTDNALSSIYIGGVSKLANHGTAENIVFGFLYRPKP